jgi:hypothetical protein
MATRPLDSQESINISFKDVLIASFIFAIAFGIVGSVFRHYIWINSVI